MRHNRAGCGGNAPTRLHRFESEQGIRAPRVKVVDVTTDEWGSKIARASCGHEVSAKGAEVGKRVSCFDCKYDLAVAAGFKG
jgi:hypothetical protein